MSAGEAPGEIIIAIGSPGTTRNSTNTMTATLMSVIAAMPTRLSRPEVMRSPRNELGSANLHPPSRPLSAYALVTSVGCRAPEWRTVLPDDAFAHVHPGLGLVLVPAPLREQAGREGKVGVLADVLVEDRAIDRLDGRIDGRRAAGRVEGTQVDVES